MQQCRYEHIFRLTLGKGFKPRLGGAVAPTYENSGLV
jgi:hypothetical protein